MELLTNYQNHLYFEQSPKSKEYALNKCIVVLGMIAKLKDRNVAIKDYCNKFYGTDVNGSIKAPEKEANDFERNIKMIKRLRKYYNYCLARVENFSASTYLN